MSDTAPPSATKLSASSHRAVTGAFDRSPNGAERLGTFIRLYLAVGRTPRTGQNRDNPWFRRFGLRTKLDRGQNEGFGLWPCQHILASKGTVRLASIIKSALIGTYGDMVRNHTLQMAAALAY